MRMMQRLRARSTPPPPAPRLLRCGGEGEKRKKPSKKPNGADVSGFASSSTHAETKAASLLHAPTSRLHSDSPLLSSRLAARLCERRRERGCPKDRGEGDTASTPVIFPRRMGFADDVPEC